MANDQERVKAIIYRHFGSPECLALEEIERPTPGEDEVLVGVRAASLNALDWHLLKGSPRILRLTLGLRKPKRIGVDVAGRVEAVGRNVTRFKPGDEVFGSARGTLAEFVCTKQSALEFKPGNVSFEQAGSVAVAGLTALQGFRDHARLREGQTVLINGAAGGVGTFAVQIAHALGAQVTGVCSTRNVGLVRSIGADRAIDYTREDFTQGPSRYDVIFDCVGNHSWAACRRVLNPEGFYLVIGGPPLRGLGLFLISRVLKRRLGAFIAKLNAADFAIIADLMTKGQVTPVIDGTYPLQDAAEAVRHLATGHARGKVVVTM